MYIGQLTFDKEKINKKIILLRKKLVYFVSRILKVGKVKNQTQVVYISVTKASVIASLVCADRLVALLARTVNSSHNVTPHARKQLLSGPDRSKTAYETF